MVSIKVPRVHFKIDLVLLLSLSFVVAGTPYRHHKYGLNPGSIVFPDDDRLAMSRFGTVSTTKVHKSATTIHEVPADREAASNVNRPKPPDNDFISNNIMTLDDSNANGTLKGRFSMRSSIEETEVNYVSRPPLPKCELRPTLIPLPASPPGLVLNPPCLEVPRCGACCFFGRKCLPTATKNFTYSIQEAKYTNNKMLKIVRRFNVTEEHHMDCKCQCDVKFKDCHSRGKIFDKTNCRCVCRNELEGRLQCTARGRQWNSDTCTCDCPEVPCEEGYFFNHKSCKCDF